LTDKEIPMTPMADVLNIETYLAVYGLTLRKSASADPIWQAHANERKSLSKWLAQQAARLDHFFRKMNSAVREALDRKGEALIQPVQPFVIRSAIESEALEKICAAALVQQPEMNAIAFESSDGARFLGGLWLEEYAWHIVKDENPYRVSCNVTGTWEGGRHQASRNEFDLLALHQNRLLVIECKTRRFGQSEENDADILYKLESLGRNAGGLFGRTLLLSARPLNDNVRSRAASQNINVIEAGELKNLRKYVQNWMIGKS
jgi:hypothetical protein